MSDQFQLHANPAIFFTDAIQVEFVRSKADILSDQCWKLPLSLEAYGALLRQDLSRVKSYFEFVDFEECKRWYHGDALHLAKNWLRESGLSFEVHDIDVAALDAPCQFLLFTHARYIEKLAEQFVRAMPEIDTFYVVAARHRVEHEFYFDSDVAAEVIRFVCERLGRGVEVIEMELRPRHRHPQFQARPMMWTGLEDILASSPSTSFGPGRVGFAPATVANAGSILNSLRDLKGQTVVFPSTWEPRQSCTGTDDSKFECSLSAADGEWSPEISVQLGKLYSEFRRRRTRSSLPAALIRNDRLDFQFEYIIRRRWLAYANMIHRAKQFARKCPLDLFIYSDHFTAEGAVLARLYRRMGTKVLVSLHSDYPCDRNWAPWDQSDQAMVPFRSSAARLREISGMSDVFVTGDLRLRSPRSLRQSLSLQLSADEKRLATGDRKVLLLVTNALELDCVPFADLKAHFRAMKVLAKIAHAMRDRVVVVLRTKPGHFGEDPTLYRELSGLLPERIALFEGLSFSQSIRLADCIVGVNVPTTGYYEILKSGVPLIYFQLADVISRHPDLPPEVVDRITDPEAIEPEIQALMFDEDYREQVIERQRRYAASDSKPDFEEAVDPVRNVVERLLRERHRPAFGRMSWWPFRRSLSPQKAPAAMDSAGPLTLGSLDVRSKGTFGHVDDILCDLNGFGRVVGWAADIATGQSAKAVHLFVAERWVAKSFPAAFRPDVAAAYGDERLQRTGFSTHFRLERTERPEALAVYAELHDRTFHLLSRSF